MSNTSLTTRIDADLKAELEQIARYERRSASFMANQAIRNLVDERRATRELLETGLALVEMGTSGIEPQDVHAWLASDEEVFPEGRSVS